MIYKYCTNKHYKVTGDRLTEYLIYVSIVGVMVYMLAYTIIIQMYK